MKKLSLFAVMLFQTFMHFTSVMFILITSFSVMKMNAEEAEAVSL